MNSLTFLDVDPAMLKTEERIIVAAIKVFAEYPLHTATIRMIAQEAQINFSSITYHFKTKENLYQEVIRRFLDHVRSIISLTESSPQPLTPESAREELVGIIERMTDWMCGGSHVATLAKIILREHFSPSSVYEMLYKDFFSKIITRLTALVRCLISKPGDTSPEETNREREATLLAFSMIGQTLVFRLQRELLVRHLGFIGFSTEEIAELKDLLVRNILRQLEVPL